MRNLELAKDAIKKIAQINPEAGLLLSEIHAIDQEAENSASSFLTSGINDIDQESIRLANSTRGHEHNGITHSIEFKDDIIWVAGKVIQKTGDSLVILRTAKEVREALHSETEVENLVINTNGTAKAGKSFRSVNYRQGYFEKFFDMLFGKLTTFKFDGIANHFDEQFQIVAEHIGTIGSNTDFPIVKSRFGQEKQKLTQETPLSLLEAFRDRIRHALEANKIIMAQENQK